MNRSIDLIGQKFNRLTVIERAENDKHNNAMWLCRCDCGNLCKATTSGLRNGNNQSCGCLHKETFNNKTHCKRNTRLYRIYAHMKERCSNENNKNYERYGGRGITVCDEWLQNFQAFYDWAMANGYKDSLTIDRIDNDKGYSPENCRWVTMKEQSNNKSCNIIITFNGKTQTLKQWADELGMNYTRLYQRIYVRGWSIEKAFKTK